MRKVIAPVVCLLILGLGLCLGSFATASDADVANDRSASMKRIRNSFRVLVGMAQADQALQWFSGPNWRGHFRCRQAGALCATPPASRDRFHPSNVDRAARLRQAPRGSSSVLGPDA